jgi:TPR repeat protein
MKLTPVALLVLCLCLWGCEKGTAPFKLTKQHAEAGDMEAQTALGMMYDDANSNEVENDFKEALKWFRKGAAQGDAKAQYMLGWYYGDGIVDEVQEFKESAKGSRKAAEQGYVDAQVSLGGLYELGYGVKKDHVIASVWYEIATKNGDTEWGAGWKNARELARKMTPDQITEAQELVKEMVKKNPKLLKK